MTNNQDPGLEELGITIGTKWSKSKNAYELNKALLEVKPKNLEQSKPMDSNVMLMQLMQTMQQKNQEMRQQSKAMQQQNQAMQQQN